MSEGMAAEDDVLEIVEDQFGGRVVVAFYLVADDGFLFVEFVLRVGAVEHDVGEQVDGPWQMLLEDGGIIDCALFVGKGIEFAADTLEGVQDVPCASACGPLEGDVLAEVRQSFLARPFVACAGSDLQSAVDHLRLRGQVDDAKSVGEGVGVVFGHLNCFLSWLGIFAERCKSNH